MKGAVMAKRVAMTGVSAFLRSTKSATKHRSVVAGAGVSGSRARELGCPPLARGVASGTTNGVQWFNGHTAVPSMQEFNGMELAVLGTASAAPSTYRNVSSYIVRMEKENLMFDCGEGTQHQLLHSHQHRGRVSRIFITHMHGDHVYGLPGLLCSLLVSQPVDSGGHVFVYGPEGIYDFVASSLAYLDDLPDASGAVPLTTPSIKKMNITVHELIGGNLWPRAPGAGRRGYAAESRGQRGAPQLVVKRSHGPRDGRPGSRVKRGKDVVEGPNGEWPVYFNKRASKQQFEVVAAPLKHRVPCFGYVVREATTRGRIDVAKARAAGLEPGPIFKKLEKGLAVPLPDGSMLEASEVLGPPLPGRKVVVMGDTCNSVAIADAAAGASLMTHECTFDSGEERSALLAGHSTPDMVGSFAGAIGVERLVLTHFSSKHFGALQEASIFASALKVIGDGGAGQRGGRTGTHEFGRGVVGPVDSAGGGVRHVRRAIDADVGFPEVIDTSYMRRVVQATMAAGRLERVVAARDFMTFPVPLRERSWDAV